MKKLLYLTFFSSLIAGCQYINEQQTPIVFKKYSEATAIQKQQNHENKRMQFKLFQSKYIDMNKVFKPFEKELSYFSEENYAALKPLILEQDIPTLQKQV